MSTGILLVSTDSSDTLAIDLHVQMDRPQGLQLLQNARIAEEACRVAEDARKSAEEACHAAHASFERERLEHAQLQKAFAPFKAAGIDPVVVPALLEAFSRIGKLADKLGS